VPPLRSPHPFFHFDAYPVPETKRYLHDHGVEVRL